MLKDKTYNMIREMSEVDIASEVDGYNYFMSRTGRAYGAHALRIIADYIDEINEEWNNQVNKVFTNE